MTGKIKESKIKQNAGNADDAKNILIVSHANRMKCVLSEIYKQDFYKKLKNTAVILMEIRQSEKDVTKSTITTRLFYEGEISDEKAKNNKRHIPYYTTNILDSYSFGIKEVSLDNTLYSGSYNIYLVRHGEGSHNLATTFDKITSSSTYLDPKLTEVGKNQAKNSGEKLRNIKFDTVFISDLYRTKETFKLLNLKHQLTPVVLPCAHEVNSYTGTDSYCDNSYKNQIVSYENESACKKCTPQDNSPKCKSCFDDVDWSYYSSYNTSDCTVNNMIMQAIKYTLNKYTTIGGGSQLVAHKVKYNNRTYTVRTDKRRKFIVIKGVHIWLADIKGKYTRITYQTP